MPFHLRLVLSFPEGGYPIFDLDTLVLLDILMKNRNMNYRVLENFNQ